MIPYGRQFIDEDDIQAVINVLKSDWLTQGPVIEQFERSLADYCGAKYAVAVSSGTAALHLSCLAAGIRHGDEAITSPITFVASANCILYCGGSPVFADIDRDNYNIDPYEIKKKITPRTKALIPVHFAGLPCNMDEISKIAKAHDLTVIEDACHALGSEYKVNRKWIKVGSCAHSDMTVFSFHPVKIITTGEGGMVLTNNKDIYHKLQRLRTHGITRDVQFMEGQTDGSWYYQQIDLGFNYRITDIQSALGRSQLKRINEFVSRRNELAERYNKALSALPLVLPRKYPDTYSTFHLYVIRLKLNKMRKSRKEVFKALQQHGIGVNVHYIPVHTQPYYKRLGFSYGQFPEAEKYYNEAITLPLYPSMTEDDQDYIVNSLREVIS